MTGRRTWRRCDGLCTARVESAGRLLLGAGDSQLRDLLPQCLPMSALLVIEDFCGAHIEEEEAAAETCEDEVTWRMRPNAPKTKRLGWRKDAGRPVVRALLEE